MYPSPVVNTDHAIINFYNSATNLLSITKNEALMAFFKDETMSLATSGDTVLFTDGALLSSVIKSQPAECKVITDLIIFLNCIADSIFTFEAEVQTWLEFFCGSPKGGALATFLQNVDVKFSHNLVIFNAFSCLLNTSVHRETFVFKGNKLAKELYSPIYNNLDAITLALTELITSNDQLTSSFTSMDTEHYLQVNHILLCSQQILNNIIFNGKYSHPAHKDEAFVRGVSVSAGYFKRKLDIAKNIAHLDGPPILLVYHILMGNMKALDGNDTVSNNDVTQLTISLVGAYATYFRDNDFPMFIGDIRECICESRKSQLFITPSRALVHDVMMRQLSYSLIISVFSYILLKKKSGKTGGNFFNELTCLEKDFLDVCSFMRVDASLEIEESLIVALKWFHSLFFVKYKNLISCILSYLKKFNPHDHYCFVLSCHLLKHFHLQGLVNIKWL